MKMNRVLLLLAVAGLSACATHTAQQRYSSQQMVINTTPDGAYCFLHNNLGNWQIDSTPATLSIPRSSSDLHISCRKPGYGTNAIAVKPIKTNPPFYPSTVLVPLSEGTHHPSNYNNLHHGNQHANQASDHATRPVAPTTNSGYDAIMAKQ